MECGHNRHRPDTMEPADLALMYEQVAKHAEKAAKDLRKHGHVHEDEVAACILITTNATSELGIKDPERMFFDYAARIGSMRGRIKGAATGRI